MVATAMGKREGGAEFTFEFHARDFPVPGDITEYTHDKLAAKLKKFGNRITAVTVWLKDENGTKGGVDKSCRMEARVAGLEPITVQELDGDIRAVIDKTLEVFESTIQRHLDRARDFHRVPKPSAPL
jgi:ribosome-associated translation inhibitor RaiA